MPQLALPRPHRGPRRNLAPPGASCNTCFIKLDLFWAVHQYQRMTWNIFSTIIFLPPFHAARPRIICSFIGCCQNVVWADTWSPGGTTKWEETQGWLISGHDRGFVVFSFRRTPWNQKRVKRYLQCRTVLLTLTVLFWANASCRWNCAFVSPLRASIDLLAQRSSFSV